MEYVFGPDGAIKRSGDGSLQKLNGLPTPCLKCPKPPAWAKRDGFRSEVELRGMADEITPENRKALDRFREYRVTGRFPDDPLVTWYSGHLGGVFEAWQREPVETATAATLKLITLLVKARR